MPRPGQGTYKASPPWASPDDSARSDQLSEWLRVPWVKTWRLTYGGSVAVATPENIPNPTATLTFKKLRDDTRLNFIVHGGGYCVVAPAVMYIDVRVNGANYPCGLVYMNNANTHIPFVGAVEVDNIPRGTYTFVLQWSRGFNTVTLDANDAWSVTLTETNRSPDL